MGKSGEESKGSGCREAIVLFFLLCACGGFISICILLSQTSHTTVYVVDQVNRITELFCSLELIQFSIFRPYNFIHAMRELISETLLSAKHFDQKRLSAIRFPRISHLAAILMLIAITLRRYRNVYLQK